MEEELVEVEKKGGRKSSEIEIRFAVCKVERRTNSYQYLQTPFKYKNRHRVIFVQMSKVIREDFGFPMSHVTNQSDVRVFPRFSSIAHWLMMKTFLMTARCDHFSQLQTTIDIYPGIFLTSNIF